MDMVINYFSGTLGQLELLATVLLIINVTLLAHQKLINYWFGLAGVLIFGYIFKEYNLYSDMLLQWVFYAPLQIVGWYMWKYGKTLGETASDGLDTMRVVTMGTQGRIVTTLSILFGTALLGSYMATYTDASFPYVDALTTFMSIAASILMLKKIWENWIIWITMDVIAIWVYYQKELYVTSGLYVVFLGLATYGLVTWYKDMQAKNV
jgi:nicotinamide mononucleotide transporter